MNPRLDRRQFLQRLAAAGLLAVPGATVLSSCATGGGGSAPAAPAAGAAKSATNPFGVVADAPLDVVIFKGGYGDDYAKAQEAIYQKAFPNAKIAHTGTVEISQEMRPRFVGGNPPDVLDSSGAQKIEISSLVADNALTDLAPLLDAPSIDDPNAKIRDTLLPGVVDEGTFNGKVYALNYAYQTFAIWYSKPLFDKNGWTAPTTFDELMALSEKIKAAGIAPLAYGGTNAANYVLDLNLGAAIKQGGIDVAKKIDNLEPNAWKQPEIVAATQKVEEMAKKGYFMAGSEALKHTEAQTQWVQGKAAMYVSGSWIENEMKTISPPDFNMAAAPIPTLDKSSKMPFAAFRSQAAEAFVVPAKAKNVNGGMEYLRVMLSKEGAGKFAELTASVPVSKGATDNVKKSPALASMSDKLKEAGDNLFNWKFTTWYSTYNKMMITEMGNLLTGRSSADKFLSTIQAESDRIAADKSIPKYTR